jgi:hypothetical protein
LDFRRAEHFAGLLTSTCCNIFICNRISEIFWLLLSQLYCSCNNTFIIHLPWHSVILINEKPFPVFQIIVHSVGNIPFYEVTFYASYHLYSAYEI